MVRIYATKTKTFRTVPVTPAFLERLREMKDKSQSSYIIEYRGRPVTTIRKSFNNACDRAGIKVPVRMYDLRHLFATTMLYPRDPSLDPQLVWKGKDEQDREDLAVPVVPIYIQEKIHPQAIIDALPRKDKPGGEQGSLFADFNGIGDDFDKKVDFYHHDQHWTNRLILGDSLLVMRHWPHFSPRASLNTKSSYATGRVSN